MFVPPLPRPVMAGQALNVLLRFVVETRNRGLNVNERAHNLILRPRQLFLEIHNLFDLNQKPTVNLGQLENFLNRESGPERVTDEKDALGVRDGEFAGNYVAGKDVAVAVNFRSNPPRLAVAAQPAAADLQRAQAFLQAFLERAPDGHRFADAFHLRGERGVGLRKFLEGEARDLGDDVINARLGSYAGVSRVMSFLSSSRR